MLFKKNRSGPFSAFIKTEPFHKVLGKVVALHFLAFLSYKNVSTYLEISKLHFFLQMSEVIGDTSDCFNISKLVQSQHHKTLFIRRIFLYIVPYWLNYMTMAIIYGLNLSSKEFKR